MKILVTGSNGFVGRNLVWNLKAIKEGKNRAYSSLNITDIYEYDIGTPQDELEEACVKSDFVFNLAGVNRPQDNAEFMRGNYGFTSILLSTLKKYNNTCPIMHSSSLQASLVGRYKGSEYGKSKLAGEKLVFHYAQETGSKVCVYRFPNLFGKWCKPDYNSAVATFCYAEANDKSYRVDDPKTELELLYIDDLVAELMSVLEGKEHRCEYDGIVPVPLDYGRYCYVPTTHRVTISRIVELLKIFKSMPKTHFIPDVPEGSFEKKLYSTYLSYLPESKIAYSFQSNVDARGNFTELIHTKNCGQVSVNIVKPGMIRGQHWHNSKWEIFIVVSGHGLIQERQIGMNPDTGEPWPVIEFEVTGEQMKAVQMLPGYTHNIINLSKTRELIVVMWANEQFELGHSDTFHESVVAGTNKWTYF